jgi:phosphoglycerol transferase MdoB-like AlkP superfamily enzyme
MFLIFNSSHQSAMDGTEIFLSFLHGARMDFSVISYLMIIPVLMFMLLPWKPVANSFRILGVYHRIVILILTILLAANVLVYHFWGNMLNYRALTYLADPAQVLHSFTGLQIFLVLVVLIVLTYVSWFIHRKFAGINFDPRMKTSPVKRGAVILSLIFILITGIRGGWQMLPLNESLISFSSNNFLNQAAFNPAWHLLYDVQMAGLTEKNPFNKVDESFAEKIVTDLFHVESDSFPQVITAKHPNIVMIILESHTSDVVASFGGEKGVSPILDSLSTQGLSFSSIISSGTRTDQGIVSLLNGWPATPYHSIMRSTEKSKMLPSIPADLKALGYHTSFYYGGESNFSNMNVYLNNQSFDKICDKEKFTLNVTYGKWGVHDEFLFAQQEHDLKTLSQPFFSVLMTLSTHEPFDVPGKPRFPGTSEADLFRNAAVYTDECLGNYFNSVRTESWYANTLFIIVADHGHRLPKHRGELTTEVRRIPMLFFGEVLDTAYRGMSINKLGGHHDLSKTLLSQLNLPTERYNWSKNLLCPDVKDFAYYQIESTVGWMENKDYIVYVYPDEVFVLGNVKSVARRDELLKRGEAFVQRLYKEYLNY